MEQKLAPTVVELTAAGWRAPTFAEGLASFDRATHLFPNHYLAWYERAQYLHKAGEFAAAVESYEKAFRLEPPPPESVYAFPWQLLRAAREGRQV